MKIILMSLVIILSMQVKAEVIKNITICAAQCQSDILGNLGHGQAQTGSLFYADYSPETSASSLGCMSEAHELKLFVDRLESKMNNDEICRAALLGNFKGKKANIKIDNESIVSIIDSI